MFEEFTTIESVVALLGAGGAARIAWGAANATRPKESVGEAPNTFGHSTIDPKLVRKIEPTIDEDGWIPSRPKSRSEFPKSRSEFPKSRSEFPKSRSEWMDQFNSYLNVPYQLKGLRDSFSFVWQPHELENSLINHVTLDLKKDCQIRILPPTFNSPLFKEVKVLGAAGSAYLYNAVFDGKNVIFAAPESLHRKLVKTVEELGSDITDPFEGRDVFVDFTTVGNVPWYNVRFSNITPIDESPFVAAQIVKGKYDLRTITRINFSFLEPWKTELAFQKAGTKKDAHVPKIAGIHAASSSPSFGYSAVKKSEEYEKIKASVEKALEKAQAEVAARAFEDHEKAKTKAESDSTAREPEFYESEVLVKKSKTKENNGNKWVQITSAFLQLKNPDHSTPDSNRLPINGDVGRVVSDNCACVKIQISDLKENSLMNDIKGIFNQDHTFVYLPNGAFKYISSPKFNLGDVKFWIAKTTGKKSRHPSRILDRQWNGKEWAYTLHWFKGKKEIRFVVEESKLLQGEDGLFDMDYQKQAQLFVDSLNQSERANHNRSTRWNDPETDQVKLAAFDHAMNSFNFKNANKLHEELYSKKSTYYSEYDNI